MDPYLFYFLFGFSSLLGTALLVIVFILLYAMGKIQGRLMSLESAVAYLRQDNASLRQEISQVGPDPSSPPGRPPAQGRAR